MRGALAFALCWLTVLAADAGRGDEAELARAWRGAMIFAPARGAAGYARLAADALERHLAGDAPRPLGVILYAHGCDGLTEISEATGRLLAQAGYLVVAPDSFARLLKPLSCDPARHLGGLHREVLAWRWDELRYADRRIAAMRALEGVPLALMGHSEGAIAVATITDAPAAARIVEGWTCHAGWPEYRGSAAPASEPVLTLVGESDPWFEAPALRGDCGAYLRGPRQRSVVYRAPDYLATKHWLSADPGVQAAIVDFLRSALGGKRN